MLKLVETLQAGVFEIALMLVTVPKTVIRVVTRPCWAAEYVAAEESRPIEERYDGYLAPIILFIVSVFPLALAIDILFEQGNEFGRRIASRSWEAKAFGVAVFAAAAPLSVSLAIQTFRGRPITRSELRPLFPVQAYVCGTFFVVATVVGILAYVIGGSRWAAPGIALLTCWLFWAEMLTIRPYCKSLLNTFLVVVTAFFLFLGLAFFSEIIVMVALGGLPDGIVPAFP